MTHTIEHNAAACRSSRHTRVQHLITADESSLAELEALLATLPICSTGRVFIEVPDAAWQTELHGAEPHGRHVARPCRPQRRARARAAAAHPVRPSPAP